MADRPFIAAPTEREPAAKPNTLPWPTLRHTHLRVSVDSGAQSPARLRRELERERMARDLCAELNEFTRLHEVLPCVARRIRHLSSADAVAIRMPENDRYPYVVHTDYLDGPVGGPMSPDGHVAQRGLMLVDCISEAVHAERWGTAPDFITPGGSFCCESLTALVNSAAGARLLNQGAVHPRHGEREAVVIIPLSARGVRIGLLELQHRRIGAFDRQLVTFLEPLAGQIGLAIDNARAYSELEASMGRLRILSGVLPICACCKKIRDGECWKMLEEFISQNSQADFTHGLCPECAESLYPEVYAREAAVG